MRALSQTVERFHIFEAPVEMLPSGEPKARSFGRVQFQHHAHNLGKCRGKPAPLVLRSLLLTLLRGCKSRLLVPCLVFSKRINVAGDKQWVTERNW